MFQQFFSCFSFIQQIIFDAEIFNIFCSSFCLHFIVKLRAEYNISAHIFCRYRSIARAPICSHSLLGCFTLQFDFFILLRCLFVFDLIFNVTFCQTNRTEILFFHSIERIILNIGIAIVLIEWSGRQLKLIVFSSVFAISSEIGNEQCEGLAIDSQGPKESNQTKRNKIEKKKWKKKISKTLTLIYCFEARKRRTKTRNRNEIFPAIAELAAATLVIKSRFHKNLYFSLSK